MNPLYFATIALLLCSCSEEITPCASLQEAVCECDGEAGEYHCEERTAQAEEAERLAGYKDLSESEDAEEVCDEMLEAFMDAGGCGSLMIPDENAD